MDPNWSGSSAVSTEIACRLNGFVSTFLRALTSPKSVSRSGSLICITNVCRMDAFNVFHWVFTKELLSPRFRPPCAVPKSVKIETLSICPYVSFVTTCTEMLDVLDNVAKLNFH